MSFLLESFPPIFPMFCFAQFFNLPDFPDCFFPKYAKVCKPVFFNLKNFTKSDSTPPYLDTIRYGD